MNIIPTPIPQHPRLFGSAQDWQRAKYLIESNPYSSRAWAFLKKEADYLLEQPGLQFVDKNLLTISRYAIFHILTLSAAAILTGDERYAQRAIEDMRCVARFPHWNPAHFLDTAEMALAVGVGYDWLYDRLSSEDRRLFEKAIVEKGLRPSFDSPKELLWWINNSANWNQVCHGGLSVAAVAIADVEPKLAEAVLQRALENIPYAAASYAPDGVWVEGTGYWGYGTMYHTVLASMLEYLHGDTCGIDQFPGFKQSADFILQATSPRGEFFNYSDSGTHRPFEEPLFWFARRFGQPSLMLHEHDHIDLYVDEFDARPNRQDMRFLALTLLWNDGSDPHTSERSAPTRWIGRGLNPIAVFRTAWKDRRARFVAVKGGSPYEPHGHMDSGSFVLESDNVRWAIDLGSDDYTRLLDAGIYIWNSEQESARWKVFRFGSNCHNILRFNNAPQLVKGRAELIRTRTDGDFPYALLKLNSIYADQIESAHRGVAFLEDGVLFQDEWRSGATAVDATWQMLTRAEAQVLANRIVLREAGEMLTLHLLAPTDLHVEVIEAATLQQAHDAPNPGVRLLRLCTHTPPSFTGTFRLFAVAGSKKDVPLPAYSQLADWK